MRNNLCSNSTRATRFALALFAVFSIILSATACVIAEERNHGYPRRPSSEIIDPRGIEGAWFITANDVSGRIEFFRTRHGWRGQIQFDREHSPEELAGVFFDHRTGNLEFVRPRYNQRYAGTLSGNRISGTFLEGDGSYPWLARKETAPTRSDLRRFEGIWAITANDVPGRLEFSWINDGWAGRIRFDRQAPWEELTDIFVEYQTGELQFLRPRYSQRYAGTLSGKQISGTFLEGGRGYPWLAWRP